MPQLTYTEPLLFLFLVIALISAVYPSKRAWLRVLFLAGLFLVGWPPVEWLLSRPLEIWYPVRPYQPTPAQAIVVLSAAVDPPHFERPYSLPDLETYRRCEYAAWIYSHKQALPVLASGGPALEGGPAYAATMRDSLLRSGVPDKMIWTEEHSHNTHENALYSARVLRKYGISSVVLVVDARSMVRAAACFRKLNFTIIPAPSSYREWGPLQEEWMPSWKAVRGNELTLHETLGLLWYRLRGWA